MTPNILVDELVKYIEQVVKEYRLEANVNGVMKAPQVVAGYLAEKVPEQRQEIPDFPHVIVRYLEDQDTEDGCLAKVRIYVGTHSEDEQNGWRDCLNVLTRIKQALLKQRFIGKAFRIEFPIHTELPEEQPYPQWVAWMTLNVTIPQSQEEGGYFDVFA